jgi:hypothetical protein
MIGPRVCNDAQGGSTPQYVIDRFPEIHNIHWQPLGHQFRGAYIQTGANMFGGILVEVVHLDYWSYLAQMTHIIYRFKQIMPGNMIIIASLPYVAPWVTIADWPTTRAYPDSVRQLLSRVNANKLFRLANKELEKVCQENGVIYYDIFSRLEMFWDAGWTKHCFYGRQSYFWDNVHFDNRIRWMICQDIKEMWGL